MDSIKKIDKVLFVVATLLFLSGIILVASATQMNTKKLIIQSVAYILGTIIIFSSSIIDFSMIKKYDWHLYALSIILLLLVYIPGLGKVQFNARSWINLGFMDFQTSELVKITYTLAYASFLDKRRGALNTIGEVFPAFIYPLPFFFLLAKQPDLGGILVFFCITVFCLYVAGLNIKYIIAGLVFTLIAIPVIYKFQLLKPHQMLRLEAFLHPGDPSYEGNFQVSQSITAIGSGQIFGKGLFQGTFVPYGFLPVAESDFIFSVLGEEFGAVGMIFVITLYFIFLSRIYFIGTSTSDSYGNIVIMGFFGMLFYQTFQNIGMTIGVIPVTGVTLPFISYGGSSLLICMIIISIIININNHYRSSY